MRFETCIRGEGGQEKIGGDLDKYVCVTEVLDIEDIYEDDRGPRLKLSLDLGFPIKLQSNFLTEGASFSVGDVVVVELLMKMKEEGLWGYRLSVRKFTGITEDDLGGIQIEEGRLLWEDITTMTEEKVQRYRRKLWMSDRVCERVSDEGSQALVELKV